MKKLISIILSVSMIFSICSVAFAEEAEQTGCNGECGILPVVYVQGFGDGIYIDPESDNPTPIYPPSGSDILKAVPDLILAIFGVAIGNEPMFGKFAVRAANKLLEKIACDENGKPVYNSSIDPMSEPVFDYHQNVTDDFEERSYHFRYDWRLSPLDNAADLKVYIEKVKALTGHDKIAIVCHSQGNTVVASYLKLYGNKDIAKIAFLSPAFQGISILGSLYRKEADLSDKADQLKYFVESVMPAGTGTDVVSVLLGALNFTGFTDGLLNFLQRYLSSQFDLVFDECLKPAFGNLAGTWSFVPDEYFNDAVEVMFGGRKDAPVLEKILYYHDNVQVKLTDIIQETMNSGTDIIICAGYNISSIPVSLTPANHSDFLIDTKYMSIGATCAPLGETLGNNYVQAVECSHNHVSADLQIDASTSAFPEKTWFFKGMNHNVFPAGYLRFLNEFLAAEETVTIHTFEEYPQFLAIDGNENLVAVTASEEKDGIFSFITNLLNI